VIRDYIIGKQRGLTVQYVYHELKTRNIKKFWLQIKDSLRQMDGWRVWIIMDRQLAFDRAHIRRSHGGYELLCITFILLSRVSADYSTPVRFS